MYEDKVKDPVRYNPDLLIDCGYGFCSYFHHENCPYYLAVPICHLYCKPVSLPYTHEQPKKFCGHKLQESRQRENLRELLVLPEWFLSSM